METTFESKIGTIKASDERIFNFVADFNNLKPLIPADKLRDFEADTDSCRFSIPNFNMGKLGLRIIEREPFKTVKISGDGVANQQFNLWVQLKSVNENDTRLKLTMKADMNPMVKMMVSKHIQGFLDKLIEMIERMPFN